MNFVSYVDRDEIFLLLCVLEVLYDDGIVMNLSVVMSVRMVMRWCVCMKDDVGV